MTTDPTPDRAHRAAFTVTVTSRADGGHYFDGGDFSAHVAQWIKADLRGHHAIAEVTVAAPDQALPPDGRASVLSDADRQFLTFALDLAADQMASRGDEFDADDEDAMERLRRLAAGERDEQQAQQDGHSCGNCEGIDPASCLTNLDRPAVKAPQGAKEAPDEAPGQWCKCPSCWGWFVEDHPGEDLDELGRDLGWWSGLPEHRDAPAGVRLLPDTEAPAAPPSPEETVRGHVLALHQIGEQLAGIESWMWEHLADVRDAAAPVAGQPPADTGEEPGARCVCGHTRAEHVTISGRLLCDECDPDSTENLVCKEFEAL